MVSRRSLRSLLNHRGFACSSTTGGSTLLRWLGEQPEPSPAAGDRRGDPGVRRGQAAEGTSGPAGLQAVLQREPLSSAPWCRRGGRGRSGSDEPLPGHGQQRAVRRPGHPPRREPRSARRGHRLGGRALPPAPGVLRARRRGRLRVAVLRGLPDRGVGDRCRLGAGAGHQRRPARPRGDGRGDHRPHQGSHRVYAEQPHRPVGERHRPSRARRAGPRPCAGRRGRGLPRVRPGRRPDRRPGRSRQPTPTSW